MGKQKQINILLSFVGVNDAGKLKGNSEGAILTALKEVKADICYLLWNESNSKDISFSQIADYLKSEILNRNLARKVETVKLLITDVTDHNEIYSPLKIFCDQLQKDDNHKYTAAISSGTPSMQVCWILLSESGEFSKEYPLKLIRVREPKFGKPYTKEVKLATALPKIISMENEINLLKQEKEALIPTLNLNLSKGTVSIGNVIIPLSPIEFSYYRYFCDLLIKSSSPIRLSGLSAPKEFLEKIIYYHKKSFPESDLFRVELESMIKKNFPLSLTTVRGNISKTNKKFRQTLASDAISKLFEISITGKRHAKLYGLNIPAEKIIIE
ncbi:MAG: RNA repair transcriptional activator RtcR family protein [Ignavibacteria bacterium]|nr:RNA repair transcriptional activator RtcR family protein [Ignavibacteria bacterium]